MQGRIGRLATLPLERRGRYGQIDRVESVGVSKQSTWVPTLFFVLGALGGAAGILAVVGAPQTAQATHHASVTPNAPR